MLKIRLGSGSPILNIDSVSFINQGISKGYFLLSSTLDAAVAITIPYRLQVYDEYSTSNFDCTPFYSPIYYKENNIFQVHVSDTSVGRIGWMFPVQSLVSTQHSFSENLHFLKYAFVTFFKLLKGELFTVNNVLEVTSFNDQIEITDFYPSNLSIFAQSRIQTCKVENFDVLDYLHSIYTYRFFICDTIEEINQINNSIYLDEPPSILKIDRISKSLKQQSYIQSLFLIHFKVDNHPLVQFHLLYQIVELIIDRVSNAETLIILHEAREKIITTREVGIKLKKLSGEDHRVNLLFNNYLSKMPLNATSLISSCNELIRIFEYEKVSVAEALYKVRNLVVHNFHSISAKDHDLTMIRAINVDFENVLAEILTLYREISVVKDPFENDSLAWLIYQTMLE